jgi:hypothetical protein
LHAGAAQTRHGNHAAEKEMIGVGLRPQGALRVEPMVEWE